MSVKIEAVKERAQAMLNAAQREKDKRAQAKKAPAGEASEQEDAAHEDGHHPIKGVGGLIDRSA